MAGTVVLARLLTPEDYGLIGMVVVVTGFIAIFKDMGLSLGTVQRSEVNHKQISTLFWINIAISAGVMVLTVLIAPLVARFYGDARLTSITIALAGTFLFSGLTIQHQALIQRQMRFGALVAIDIISLVGGLIAAVAAASRGAGYWALVINQLVLTFINAAGVWIVCGWRPGMPVRYSGVRPMLAIGGNFTAFSVINYFARNLDNALIGRFWGAYELGLYARAYQLLTLPIDQINWPATAVVVPVLSRLVDSPERYREAYLRILEKITMVTMPGVAFLIGTSDWLVALMLGPRWSGVSRIFMLLGVAGLVQPVTNSVGWLFTSQGDTRRMFHIGALLGVIAIVSIIAGLPWGAVGVALSYASVDLLIRGPLLFWLIGRRGPIRTGDFYRTMAPSFVAALGVLLSLFLLRRALGSSKPLVGLVVSFPLAAVTGLALLSAQSRGRRALLDLKGLLPLVLKRGEIG
jgi:O-antigen/teichoic acid export membrane protein